MEDTSVELEDFNAADRIEELHSRPGTLQQEIEQLMKGKGPAVSTTAKQIENFT